MWLMHCILLDVLKCLGDNKKHMLECALCTLDTWLGVAHSDKMAQKGARIFFIGYQDNLLDWLSDGARPILYLSPYSVQKFERYTRFCALAIIGIQLKPYGALQDNYESGGYVSSSTTSESSLMTAKPNGHGNHESWHGSRNASSDDRERIIVRRFKLEELRIEEIQDLETFHTSDGEEKGKPGDPRAALRCSEREYLIITTLSTIGALGTAMGQPLEKSSKVFSYTISYRFIMSLLRY
ncbi:hypothetical protein SASPL_131089 [Salvia splendens]|uniref:Uncharacterized protein n=1 Tax=Salvia splendens TaxID=180675 RepID=A0A8X8ZKI9_SALSN|nr:hypothetical protein SASPL_131089 [Salvia splendens]